MSMVFFSGKDGCFAIFENDEARQYADRVVTAFAIDTNERSGEFPSVDEQADAWVKAYERFEQGDCDQWDWADEQAWELLGTMMNGTELEATRTERILVADALRKAFEKGAAA